MKIHVVTKDQLDETNNYIGSVDLTDFDGAIEIEENLGTVKFLSLNASFYILAKAGSGIEAEGSINAGECIESRWGIEAGGCINAGGGIKAGECIEAEGDIKAEECIEAEEDIKAGWGINAGWDIKAGGSINAGEGIGAGGGINAGEGINAGLSIKAKFVFTPFRIFVGLCSWKLPSKEEMQLVAEIRNGTLAYGEHVIPKRRIIND